MISSDFVPTVTVSSYEAFLAEAHISADPKLRSPREQRLAKFASYQLALGRKAKAVVIFQPSPICIIVDNVLRVALRRAAREALRMMNSASSPRRIPVGEVVELDADDRELIESALRDGTYRY